MSKLVQPPFLKREDTGNSCKNKESFSIGQLELMFGEDWWEYFRKEKKYIIASCRTKGHVSIWVWQESNPAKGAGNS